MTALMNVDGGESGFPPVADGSQTPSSDSQFSEKCDSISDESEQGERTIHGFKVDSTAPACHVFANSMDYSGFWL